MKRPTDKIKAIQWTASDQFELDSIVCSDNYAPFNNMNRSILIALIQKMKNSRIRNFYMNCIEQSEDENLKNWNSGLGTWDCQMLRQQAPRDFPNNLGDLLI